MTERRKLNVKNFLLFVILVVTFMAIVVISGLMPWDPVGILAGVAFFVILALIGFVIDKLGLGKIF